jgi:hypothetical protein
MKLQFCVPGAQGRGAGLGNKLFPCARAYLLSRVLGAQCLPPASGIDRRSYRQHFATPRLDRLWHRLLARTLPSVNFGEAEYLKHGGGDVSDAFASFAEAHGLASRTPLVVVTPGMWGGLPPIERALEFVRGVLYNSRFAAANLAELAARLDPAKLTVAMHVRLGDFRSTDEVDAAAGFQGRFNVSLPMPWFLSIGQQLRSALGERLQFQIFSDGNAAQLETLREALQPVSTACTRPGDVSDLLAMSKADALICTVSSYSVCAAALSRAHYVWFRPQLQLGEGGMSSIWGNDPGQQLPRGPTALAAMAQSRLSPELRVGRAHAMSLGDRLPQELLDDLSLAYARRRREADLVRCGVVP